MRRRSSLPPWKETSRMDRSPAISPDAAHLRRRTSRPRRLGDRSRARGSRLSQHSHRESRAARPARPGRGQLLVPRQPARLRASRRRDGRRDPREQHAPGGVHLRQPDDPRDRRARELPLRRPEAAVPRQLLHLPASGRAADHRERAARRPAWSRRTRRTRSPRSPASSCARRTADSTAATSSRRCRPTSTGRTTTSTSRRVTCSRR